MSNRTLPQLCRRCRKVKMPDLGRFHRVSGRCHDSHFVCFACDDPNRVAPGRDRKLSYTEIEVQRVLISSGVVFKREFPLDKFWFDFAVPELMLLIEVDSTRYHSSGYRRNRDQFKDALAVERGWKIVRVRMPDLEGKVQAAIANRRSEMERAV